MGHCGWVRDCEALPAFTYVASLMRFCTRVNLTPESRLCIHLDTGSELAMEMMLTCHRLHGC